MMIVHSSIVYRVRERFPVGTSVELVRMMAEDAPPVGTRGVVLGVDNNATIAVKWADGSVRGIVYMEDECKIVDKEN